MGNAGPRLASAPPLLLPLLLLLLRAERPQGTELTFELPDSAKQCFHEDVPRGVRLSLDYQVGLAPAPGVAWRGCPGRRCIPASGPEWPLRAPGPTERRLRLAGHGRVPGLLGHFTRACPQKWQREEVGSWFDPPRPPHPRPSSL